MYNLFFYNMLLIITCTYIFVKVKTLFYEKIHEIYFVFSFPIFINILSILIKAPHNILNINNYEIMFSLGSLPTLIISYIYGWKIGFIAAILNLLFKFNYLLDLKYIIIIEMLLPVILGSLFHNRKKQIQLINIRKILVIVFIFSFCKILLTKILINVPYSIWLQVYTYETLFSIISVLCMSLMINDLQKSIISKKKLKETKEKYQKLFEFLPDAVFIHDKEKVINANVAAAKLLGVEDPKMLIGTKISDYLFEHNKKQSLANIKSVIKNKENVNLVERKIIRPDGKIIDIEISSTYLKDDEQVYGLTTMRNISEKKQIESLQGEVDRKNKIIEEIKEYDKLKTEFFSNVSHELRTPLNVILSTLYLIDDKADSIEVGKIVKYKKMVKQNCYRLLRLITNVIDSSRIDSKFIDLNLQNCNIVSIVEDIVLSVAEYIKSKNITILFNTYVEERIIACDPDKIERIMLNLLSNAVKFMKIDGCIKVNIYNNEENITISVKDTGIGIAQDKLDIIFDRFRQVDKSFTRNHEGSGIGLSLVYSFVKMHGGEITVNSEYGKGTEFIIKLPAKVLPEESNEIITKGVFKQYNHIERVNIEFSDIYSINQIY